MGTTIRRGAEILVLVLAAFGLFFVLHTGYLWMGKGSGPRPGQKLLVESALYDTGVRVRSGKHVPGYLLLVVRKARVDEGFFLKVEDSPYDILILEQNAGRDAMVKLGEKIQGKVIEVTGKPIDEYVSDSRQRRTYVLPQDRIEIDEVVRFEPQKKNPEKLPASAPEKQTPQH